jgi:uncharacterized protein YfeS
MKPYLVADFCFYLNPAKSVNCSIRRKHPETPSHDHFSMNKYLFLLLPTSISLNQSSGQSDSGRFEFSLKIANPAAQQLMNEDFYWSPIEETGPFGSDDGSDAAYGFRKWRMSHLGITPMSYLKELFARWNYPYIALDEMDTAAISKYLKTSLPMAEDKILQQVQILKDHNSHNPGPPGKAPLDDQQLRNIVISASQNMGIQFLVGIDNSIIGTAFAQFVLEGKIDTSLKALSEVAIRRELMQILLTHFGEDYRNRRKSLLEKMLSVVEKMHS